MEFSSDFKFVFQVCRVKTLKFFRRRSLEKVVLELSLLVARYKNLES